MHNFFRTNILFLNFERDMSRSVEPHKIENRKKKKIYGCCERIDDYLLHQRLALDLKLSF